jgi:hypothetical protein
MRNVQRLTVQGGQALAARQRRATGLLQTRPGWQMELACSAAWACCGCQRGGLLGLCGLLGLDDLQYVNFDEAFDGLTLAASAADTASKPAQPVLVSPAG